jgi:hypothetical protein
MAMEPADYMRLVVTDTGSGRPPEVVGRAFEPFFTTKEPGKGTGLSLATIYGFAKQSGGQATIGSEVGKGTTVAVYLSRHSRAEASAKSKAPKKRDAGTRPSETVLVVEDNPGVRDLTVRRLGILGYKVLVAKNGPAAVAVLEKGENVDLVFSDVVMAGGMSGGEVAEGFGTFFSEWQNFVGHRLQQDLFLWQKLAESRSPQDIVAVYADFWQKAAADYCQEYAAMSKLLAGITGKVISQAQSASIESAKIAPSARAA